ncbi:MAG: hypothetical protein KC978_24435, partial [Candidatus Omnitrophica bacterium]|nr:hypothetical protein [Candidatus Omnitrophota bacterium]
MTKRYGIAEWFGRDFSKLSAEKIQQIASHPPRDCPFRYPPDKCNKAGGVCSLRLYSDDSDGTEIVDDRIVTTCPNRFINGGEIFSRVAEFLIGTKSPFVTTEIPFLLSVEEERSSRAVGMIDMVLVDLDSDPLNWCAMEIQAVYFSGGSMTKEIKD